MSYSSSAVLTASQYFRNHSPAGVPGPTRGMSPSVTWRIFLAPLDFMEMTCRIAFISRAEAVFLPALQHGRSHLVGGLRHLPAKALFDRAIGHQLRSHAVLRRRGFEAARDAARNDEHVGRRLEARRQRPQHLVGIVDVHILVDDENMFPLAAPGVKRRGE